MVGPDSAVQAVFGSISGTATIAVSGATLQSLTLTPASPTVTQSGTLQLTAIGNFSDGTTQNLTSQVSWTSANITLAQVSAGGALIGGNTGGAACAQAVVTATSGEVRAALTATVVRGSGSAYACGDNSYGELGNGSSLNSNSPVEVAQGGVPPGVKFTSVSAGQNFSLALGSNGIVYAWGSNDSNQLGIPYSTLDYQPIPIFSQQRSKRTALQRHLGRSRIQLSSGFRRQSLRLGC